METNLSPVIQQQIPSFVQDESFSDFLVAYYKWLESFSAVSIEDVENLSINLLVNETEFTLPAETRQVYSSLSSIKDYRDSTKAPVSMLSKFVYEYMNGVPIETASSIRSNMSLMKNFYENKGNEKSIEFLFNLLYKEVISLSYPSDRIVKLSDSRWIEKTFIRVEGVSSGVLNAMIGERVTGSVSGAEGYIDGFTYHALSYGHGTHTHTRNYHKLSVKDLTIPFDVSDEIMLGEITVGLMPGLTDITFATTGSGAAVDLFPTDKLSISFTGGSEEKLSFGSQAKIKELGTLNSVTGKVEPAPIEVSDVAVVVAGGDISLINDFYEVYELESGLTIEKGDVLTGQKSGAIATISEVDGSKFWVKDLGGTLLSDYQVNEQGASELVDVIKQSDSSITTTIRLRKKYSASDIPAQIFFKLVDGSEVLQIPYGGLNYRFNPIDENNSITISGFGAIKSIEIPEMGYLGGESIATVKVVGTDQTLGSTFITGVSGTEKFFESQINTLDGEAKLRDSNYYQEFSYEIKSQVPMINWAPTVSRLAHPAGMKLFGKEEVVSAPFDLSLTDQVGTTDATDFEAAGVTEVIDLGTDITSIEYSYDTGDIELDFLSANYSENVIARLYTQSGEINWNDSSFVTEYGEVDTSKTYFNDFSTTLDASSTIHNLYKNRLTKTYSDFVDGHLDSTEEISAWKTQRGIIEEIFEIEEESSIDLFERGGDESQQKAERIIKFDDFIELEDGGEGIDSSKNGQGRVYLIEDIITGLEDGDNGGGEILGRGGKDFKHDYDPGYLEASGDGGEIIIRKSKVYEIEPYNSYWYME